MMLRWLLGVTAVAACGALFTACGSGGGSSSSSSTAAPASTASGAATSAATASKSSSGSGGGNLGDMKAALAKFQGAKFKADYTTTIGSAAAQALTDAKLTMTKDGGNLRVDVSGKQNGNDVSFTIINAGSTSVFCLKGGQVAQALGAAAAGGVCFKSDATTARFNPGTGIQNTLQRFSASDVTLLDTSSRTIAGQNATCYHTQKAGETTTSTVCLGKDGTLLYGGSDGANAGEITATDVSGSVSGGDFNPPFPVRSMPGVPGGAPAQ